MTITASRAGMRQESTRGHLMSKTVAFWLAVSICTSLVVGVGFAKYMNHRFEAAAEAR